MISEVSKEINSYIILKDNNNETYIINYDINHNKNEIEVSSSFKSIKIIESQTIGRINDNTIYNNFTQETNLSYALLFGTEFAVK